jgi:hypothetical protein
MSTEHRRAPRRKVTEVTKTGSWGQVRYLHKLSCGHVESRARASSTESLACAWCLRVDEKSSEMKAISASPIHIFEEEEEQSLTDFEMTVERTRSGIASRFGIPIDAIDISVRDVDGKFVIKSAVVFLSSHDVARISKPN